jgi:hypothetical protein
VKDSPFRLLPSWAGPLQANPIEARWQILSGELLQVRGTDAAGLARSPVLRPTTWPIISARITGIRSCSSPISPTSSPKLHSVFCCSPHSLQVNAARTCPGAAKTRFDAPHFPHTASIRVLPCFTATVFRSIASFTRRSVSSRIDCFVISRFLPLLSLRYREPPHTVRIAPFRRRDAIALLNKAPIWGHGVAKIRDCPLATTLLACR